MSATNRIRIAPQLRRRIEEHGERGYPLESCGLLIGRAGPGETVVEGVTHARNLNKERAHDRYVLDPRDFLAAQQQATEQGADVVGIWHSHPDHPARPSQTDLDAAWPEYSYVIVSVADGNVRGLRSWRLDGDNFIEERLEYE